ncbi:MAG TPA: 8-oxo-dGTP diphosphatase MutT [Humisphaera sp.]|nr:8-oxo-dGTP diphosphatase MutT [Humisphaera sp.]
MSQIDVAIAIIHRSGKVLICQRRKNDTFADLWEFPGGKVEAGETPEQCLAREIHEELGISVRIDNCFPTIAHDYPQLTVHLFPFLCTIQSGEPRPLASQRLQWVAVNDLSDFPFPAANAALLQDVVALLGQER